MRRAVRILGALATTFAGAAVLAGDVTLESMPPVVVKTVPEAGAAGVDPKLAEIKVTFSKDMQDGGWSWTIPVPTQEGSPCKTTSWLSSRTTAGPTAWSWTPVAG